MSEYSLDSLESIGKDTLTKNVLVHNDNVCNLEAGKSVESVKRIPFYLNPILTISPRTRDKQDNVTEANGTVRGASRGRCARTTDGRNSIIASGRGFARRQECRDEPWLCIRRRDAVVDRGRCEEEGDANRRRTSRPTTKRRSPGARNSSSKCSLSNGGDVDAATMRSDKKLGNVFASRTQGPCRTSSYSELYLRRFSIQRYPCIRSPEGSTLSICGDSQLEKVSLDEGRTSLLGTPRDNSSELSFYRRFVQDHADHVTRTIRSCEISRQGSSNAVFPEVQCGCSVSEGKLKKLTYRPYTIEEYRSLSVPRPDRSLGPDKDEVQRKREWLMRRRSYGDSVSARNREQILHRARRLKGRENSRIPEMDGTTQKSLLKCPVRYSREEVTLNEASPSRNIDTLEKTSSFDSSLLSYAVLEASHLEMLRQRHLQEKELADRLMRQTLDS